MACRRARGRVSTCWFNPPPPPRCGSALPTPWHHLKRHRTRFFFSGRKFCRKVTVFNVLRSWMRAWLAVRLLARIQRGATGFWSRRLGSVSARRSRLLERVLVFWQLVVRSACAWHGALRQSDAASREETLINTHRILIRTFPRKYFG